MSSIGVFQATFLGKDVGPSGCQSSHVVQTLGSGSFLPGWSSRAGEHDGKVRMSQRCVFAEKKHGTRGYCGLLLWVTVRR